MAAQQVQVGTLPRGRCEASPAWPAGIKDTCVLLHGHARRQSVPLGVHDSHPGTCPGAAPGTKVRSLTCSRPPALMTFDRARQQVRFHELLRRFGGPESPAAVKIAVLAIARDFRSAAPVSATAVNSPIPGSKDAVTSTVWLERTDGVRGRARSSVAALTQPCSLIPSPRRTQRSCRPRWPRRGQAGRDDLEVNELRGARLAGNPVPCWQGHRGQQKAPLVAYSAHRCSRGSPAHGTFGPAGLALSA